MGRNQHPSTYPGRMSKWVKQVGTSGEKRVGRKRGEQKEAKFRREGNKHSTARRRKNQLWLAANVRIYYAA